MANRPARAGPARRRAVTYRCSSCRRRAGRAVPPPCSCLSVGPRHSLWGRRAGPKHGVPPCHCADAGALPALDAQRQPPAFSPWRCSAGRTCVEPRARAVLLCSCCSGIRVGAGCELVLAVVRWRVWEQGQGSAGRSMEGAARAVADRGSCAGGGQGRRAAHAAKEERRERCGREPERIGLGPLTLCGLWLCRLAIGPPPCWPFGRAVPRARPAARHGLVSQAGPARSRYRRAGPKSRATGRANGPWVAWPFIGGGVTRP